MRNSTKLLNVLIVILLLGGIVTYDCFKRLDRFKTSQPIRNQFQQTVGLPDLAVTTAARYLRHYSLSDATTPFQDYPVSREHFPAGFAYTPPDYSDFPSRLSLQKHPKNKYP